MIGRTQLAEVEHDDEFSEQFSEENLRDKSEIRRIVDQIDNACDAKDWKKCRSYFTDEVEVDFTSLTGGEPAKITADELIENWKKDFYEDKNSFQQRTNHRIRIEGDEAEVFSKSYAFNLLETGEITAFWEVWANYTHKLVKTESGWKCAAMKLEVIYQRGDDKLRKYTPEK